MLRSDVKYRFSIDMSSLSRAAQRPGLGLAPRIAGALPRPALGGIGY